MASQCNRATTKISTTTIDRKNLEGSSVASGHGVPVDQRVERGDVVRALVALIDVVGVLPDVHGQDGGRLTVHPRVLGIGRLAHLKLLRGIVHRQPRPSASELRRARGRKLRLEFLKASKVTVDGGRKVTRRLSTAVRAHALPEERVVDHLGGVVEGGRRRPVVPRLHHDLDHVHAVHVGALDLTVQVVHVRRMVLPVVNFQGFLAHDGLEGILGVGQVRQGDSLADRGLVHRAPVGGGDLAAKSGADGHHRNE
mmetsp:Transcript_12234/g.34742  ORF Transcript_12234/g.34742 Transcript_12234/m.34742 type:complete len:254 (+) Transcript_12234:51-812(+)